MGHYVRVEGAVGRIGVVCALMQEYGVALQPDT